MISVPSFPRPPDVVVANPDAAIGQNRLWWVEQGLDRVRKGIYVYVSAQHEVLYVGVGSGQGVVGRLHHHFTVDERIMLAPGLSSKRYTYQNEFPGKGTRVFVWYTRDGDEAKLLEAILVHAVVETLGRGPAHNRTIPMSSRDGTQLGPDGIEDVRTCCNWLRDTFSSF